MGMIFYPGRTRLGVDVYCNIDREGNITLCPDQALAKQQFERGPLGAEITDPALIAARLQDLLGAEKFAEAKRLGLC